MQVWSVQQGVAPSWKTLSWMALLIPGSTLAEAIGNRVEPSTSPSTTADAREIGKTSFLIDWASMQQHNNCAVVAGLIR